MGIPGYQNGVLLNIHSDDGTGQSLSFPSLWLRLQSAVLVASSGAEIGQGLNTKLAQTIAYKLGIDISLISCAFRRLSRED